MNHQRERERERERERAFFSKLEKTTRTLAIRVEFDVGMSAVRTSFVLHSKRNRLLYPESQYPLTHFLDRQNVARRCPHQSTFLRRAIYAIVGFLGLTLFVCGFFRTHVYLYNQFRGPFHVDRKALAVQVNNFHQNAWLPWRKEYFQVELGEDNIQNPASSAETIRRFSDPWARQRHTATYKRVSQPWTYVKLPTRPVTYFHHRFPFDFRLFTTLTLRCIVKRLVSESDTHLKLLIDKAEYVQFIDDEYTRNVTRFNSMVLSKCGVLIGYLYRPVHERAFLLAHEHTFTRDDIALDVTQTYASSLFLLIQVFLGLVLFSSGIYHLFVYLSVFIRVRHLHPRGILSFPLEFTSDLVEELFLLNSDDPVEEQLLQLDSHIQRSEHRFLNQMFVIGNDLQQSFVVFFPENLDALRSDETPLVICPVTDIRSIVHDRGICYGREASWIPWPMTFADSAQNYSEWLHGALLEASDHYRTQ